MPAPVVSISLAFFPLATALAFFFSSRARSRPADLSARSSKCPMVRSTWARPRTVIAASRVSAFE